MSPSHTFSVDRWSRTYVATSAVLLVAWQASSFVDTDWRSRLILGVLGFVLHVVFGKAYTLVPSYFETSLAYEAAPAVQFPLTSLGTLILSANPGSALGGILWIAGVGIFVVSLGVSLRGNLTGRETGTAETKQERRTVDRYSNAAIPFALVYLVLGSYLLVASNFSALPCPVSVGCQVGSVLHLLAAGTGGVMVFGVGFRLLPRLLVSHPSRRLVALVLPTGVVAPSFLALDLNGGILFRLGAVLESVAVIGFGAAYFGMVRRSERRRVGLYGVLAGAVFGALGVVIGSGFAFDVFSVSDLRLTHARLNVLGFLGLTIIGVAYQFYPPNVGSFLGANDETALASIALIASGLVVETASSVTSVSLLLPGRLLTLVGTSLYAYVLLRLFYEKESGG